jgi:PEP-CTERM motif
MSTFGGIMKHHWTKTILIGGLMLLAESGAARADSFTFATDPASGVISGLPGSTIGWGYTITNTSPDDYVEMTALDAGAFLNGTPLLIFDFPIIAPGTTVAVPFIADVQGLYQLTLDTTAPAGSMNSGMFMLTGDFCTDSDCLFTVPDSTLTQTVSYAATVSGSGAVPEPASVLLIAAGLGGVVARKKRTAR